MLIPSQSSSQRPTSNIHRTTPKHFKTHWNPNGNFSRVVLCFTWKPNSLQNWNYRRREGIIRKPRLNSQKAKARVRKQQTNMHFTVQNTLKTILYYRIVRKMFRFSVIFHSHQTFLLKISQLSFTEIPRWLRPARAVIISTKVYEDNV
jgi:hypothetical protein